MNLNEEVRTVLESAGFRTTLGASSTNSVYFENNIIVGCVFIHATCSALFAGWEECQDKFLGTNSSAIRSDPAKAWNVYTVHLTSDSDPSSRLSDAFNIEQDFRGTRKIVRASVVKRSDVREALLPLLPLQHRISLTTGKISERLKDRLALSSLVLVRLIDKSDQPGIEHDLLEEA